ncbi:MAG: alpha/beta hydrolase fold domain-containing protein [Agriterribacter sp.]
MQIRRLFIAGIFLLSSQLLQAQEDLALNRTNEESTIKNLLFKISPDGDSLLLDLFRPVKSSTKPTPVFIIIHGGAWIIGDRNLEDYAYVRKLRDELVKNNISVISIEYTLVKQDRHFPGPIADCQDAIRWVRANAGKFQFDTTNIGLWGGSAGGHLALLAANTNDTTWKGNTDLAGYSHKVNYVVDNFGPTNLTDMLQLNAGKFKIFLAKIFIPKALALRNRLIQGIFNMDMKTNRDSIGALAKSYSPIHYISATTLPTLIFHGTKDRLVPYRQSKELQKALDENKVFNKMITVKKGNHGFTNISEEKTDELVKETMTFVLAQIAATSPN